MAEDLERKEMSRPTRVLAISDMHCGHNVGLTPPAWHVSAKADKKLARIQRELWGFYAKKIKELQPVDRLMVLGDCVDGLGKRSGGTEQITMDRNRQTDMAAECINFVKAKKVIMVYGTPYHTGNDEDWEDIVAGKVNNLVKIGSQEWPEVNGVIFDIKHKIGASSIPHGRMTALAKAKMWNRLWHSEHERQPMGEILIRAHVHYHNFCGGPGWIAMTLPALQGYGSKFGARECEGTVDIGMVVFDIDEKGNYEWQLIKAELPQQKAKILPF